MFDAPVTLATLTSLHASGMETSMMPHRLVLPVLLVTVGLTLTGCSTAPSTGDGGAVPSGSSPSAGPEVSAAACPAEMDEVASAGLDFVRVAPAEYVIAGIEEALLESACLYEFTSGGKVGQWAWFPGASAADITGPLVATGYALTDSSDGAERYAPASGVNITVFAVLTAEEAAALGGQKVFSLLGPYVAAFQDFS